MHEPVRHWVRHALPPTYTTVAEYGSQDMNGNIKDLLHNGTQYTGYDIAPGNNVDIVTDCSTVTHDPVDVILCLEVFEHTQKWQKIIQNAYNNLITDGGVFIATMAGPGRFPHSGRSAGPIESDEYYENIATEALLAALRTAGFGTNVVVDQTGLDVRCRAERL